MTTHRNLRAAAIAIACGLLASAPAAAEAASTANPEALSDDELDRRIAWLTETLDGSAGYAKFWQYGWTSGYALGLCIGTARAATTHDDDARVNAIVTASKAVLGTTRLLLKPLPGRLGADPIRAVDGSGRAAKLQQLAAGELQLERVAGPAGRRLHWHRHAGNVAINLIGSAFILGFGDEVDAAVSSAIGIAVGELMIFTSPKVGASNLEAYRERFAGAPRRPGWRVSLVPTGRGAAVRVDF